MTRWTTNDNRIFDNSSGWCQYAAGPGFAEAIVARHNADIAALEAERDEYKRRLALAENALVPVPHGEPCERRKCCHDHCLYDGVVFSDNWDERPTNIITGKRHDIPWDAIVQPVRLVPLAELIDQKGCGVSDTR